MEYDEKTIVDKAEKIEKSLHNNYNVETDAKDRKVDSNKLLHESIPFNNLHNTNTEGIKTDNSYTDPITGDHIENLVENRIETINATIEEELGQDNQYEDSSESEIVISGQSFHPEDDKIGVYDENQNEEFVTQEINESFYNHYQYQVEPTVNGRTRLEELKEIMEDWINYNYNEHESEEESQFAREKMIKIQEEKQVSLEEWDYIWIMFLAEQRRLEELEERELEIEEIEEENELTINFQNDIVRAKNRQEEKSIYFREDEIFTLEVPVRKHRKPNNVKADSTKIQKCFIKKNKKLVIEFKRDKQAPCADTYLTKETTKERTIDWCEEYKLNKIILLNYTERGKQLRNIELRNIDQKQGGQRNYNCNYETITTITATKTAKNTNTVTIFYHTLLTYTAIFNYLFYYIYFLFFTFYTLFYRLFKFCILYLDILFNFYLFYI